MKSIQVLFALLLCVSSTVESFATHNSPSKTTTLRMAKNDGKSNNIFDDFKGMFNNFDDVVDDFLFKRMGAGEQWYGKRKYSPSGKVEGDYNGMGRSSSYSIEIAKKKERFK
jgi:hypothetical protein